MKSNVSKTAVFQALLAALLFGLNAPFAKMLLRGLTPVFMAALLYLGAGLGMGIVAFVIRYGDRHRNGQPVPEAGLSGKDAVWVVLMIVLDIVAPFLLMLGLTRTSAATASLLNNFEMVATALIALLFFHEAIGRRVWISLGLITLASMVLGVDIQSWTDISFSTGALLVLGACLCWGLENNCTRNLSDKDPLQIVIIKGFGSGLGALFIGLIFGMPLLVVAGGAVSPDPSYYISGFSLQALGQIGGALLLGFFSYGLSIYFYIHAQRRLGAARTSLYYAAAPFIGAAVSFILLQEHPGVAFFIGAALMLGGTILVQQEKHRHAHLHAMMVHEHAHNHLDGHHLHSHGEEISQSDPAAAHSHQHQHLSLEHSHEHQPDSHHRHTHDSSVK